MGLKSLACGLAFAAAFTAQAEDTTTLVSPESQGVSSEAIRQWVMAEQSQVRSLHSFVLLRHGKLIASGAAAPYKLDRPHQLYSHSKSFTSTALGFLVDDGKLDIDQPLIEIFPEKFPANPHPYIAGLRVRDLLSMTTGFKRGDAMHRDHNEKDWLKLFFTSEPGVAPGTRFSYDTCATHVLAAVVEKLSGKPLEDFLKERLCGPLGFGEFYSHNAPNAIACGGYGMYARTEDLAKFGQLYLQKGMWNGQQILSADWIAQATSKQQNNAPSWSIDWASGYGFQFWRCSHNAFRADGSHGQFTVVMPDQDVVLSMTACTEDMGTQLNLVWEKLLPGIQDGPLPENPEALLALRKMTERMRILPVICPRMMPPRIQEFGVDFAPNKRGYKRIDIRVLENGGWEGTLKMEGLAPQTFKIGFGQWEEGMIRVLPDEVQHEIIGELIGPQPIAASGAWLNMETYRLAILFLDQAHRLELSINPVDGKVTAEGRHIGLGGCTLKEAQ